MHYQMRWSSLIPLGICWPAGSTSKVNSGLNHPTLKRLATRTVLYAHLVCSIMSKYCAGWLYWASKNWRQKLHFPFGKNECQGYSSHWEVPQIPRNQNSQRCSNSEWHGTAWEIMSRWIRRCGQSLIVQ